MSSAVYTASKSTPNLRLDATNPARSTLDKTTNWYLDLSRLRASTVSGNTGQSVTDWENFKHNSAPLGFDALNLIFEQTLIEYQINKTINNIAEKIKLLIELLVKNKSIDELFFHKPLNKIIDFVRNNRHIWGEQCEKLPILKFNKELVELVDKEISYDK